MIEDWAPSDRLPQRGPTSDQPPWPLRRPILSTLGSFRVDGAGATCETSRESSFLYQRKQGTQGGEPCHAACR